MSPPSPVYESYIRPEIVYVSETWCLKESEIGILRKTMRSMVITICGVQLKARKRSMDLILMLGLNVTIGQLAIAISVHLYGYVLRTENDQYLEKGIRF